MDQSTVTLSSLAGFPPLDLSKKMRSRSVGSLKMICFIKLILAVIYLRSNLLEYTAQPCCLQ